METERATGGRRQRRGRPDGHRGATVVEYALGIALVCIASIGALEFLADGASDDLNERADRSGAPDLGEVAPDGGTDGGSSGSGSDGTDDAVPPVEVFFAGFSKASAQGANNKPWSASIEVNVADVDGDGIDGARVEGVWTYTSGGVPFSIPAICNQTNPQGICKFQLSDIPHPVHDVTFTMTDISGGVPEVAYNGGPQVAPAIINPHP